MGKSRIEALLEGQLREKKEEIQHLQAEIARLRAREEQRLDQILQLLVIAQQAPPELGDRAETPADKAEATDPSVMELFKEEINEYPPAVRKMLEGVEDQP